jgi:prepilin-type N-terminal cleavage/methylation domain-containing protein
MNSLLPFRTARRRAFSLLELLAVVTIIGVIAALIIYRVNGVVGGAKDKVQLHQISELNMAIENYYMANEAWPASLNDLVPGHLPDGVPTPPNGGTYTIDPATHRAIAN